MAPSTEKPHEEALGPDYVAEEQKPKATVSTVVPHENVIVLPQTSQLISLLTYVES